MNIQEIDKWLDNEYGVSYTRLEELHDFAIEQDLKHREEKDKEIERLNNIINELERILQLEVFKTRENSEYNKGLTNAFNYTIHMISELKGSE